MLKKKELNKSLSNRKKELVGKANNILTSGEYNNVNEIFEKVFNKDELNIIYSRNQENKEDNENYNSDKQDKEEKDDKGNFFTTQQV